MREPFNPTRRNRNIGTSKSGYGCNNKLIIPDRFADLLIFWERVYDCNIKRREFKGEIITFIIEKTKKNYFYSCTIDDILKVLEVIPEGDWNGINLFVFRQPKKKEVILNPVWGRLGYNVDIKGHKGPAIILEAVNINSPIIWDNSLTPDKYEELERLREDGHVITQSKRSHSIQSSAKSTRFTQLYRTLPHEIGHWVHWNKAVVEPSKNGQDYDELEEKYFNLDKKEKEIFAHKYAGKIKLELISKNI